MLKAKTRARFRMHEDVLAVGMNPASAVYDSTDGPRSLDHRDEESCEVVVGGGHGRIGYRVQLAYRHNYLVSTDSHGSHDSRCNHCCRC